MNGLIRYIRAKSGMSQEQFASKIGTTSITVNRWENGHSTPNTIAQHSLFSFCKNKNIDISEYILYEIKSKNNKENILYHGSKDGLIVKIAPISRSRCDFGAGFYTGTNPLQPLTLICSEEKPHFYTLHLNANDINILTLNDDLEWAMLIAYNRGYMDHVKGSEIYEKYSHMTDGYDIVVGYIADDRIYQTLTDFFNGIVTDRVLIESLSVLELGTQYVAITQKGCDAFDILDEKLLQPIELLALREKSKLNRSSGIRLAEETRVKFRREGRFFDEIMKGEEVL